MTRSLFVVGLVLSIGWLHRPVFTQASDETNFRDVPSSPVRLRPTSSSPSLLFINSTDSQVLRVRLGIVSGVEKLRIVANGRWIAVNIDRNGGMIYSPKSFAWLSRLLRRHRGKVAITSVIFADGSRWMLAGIGDQ